MNRSGERNLARVLVLGAAIAALGLAGCGRKGGLDPPPSAAVPQQSTQAAAPGLSPIGNAPSDPADQRNALGERAGMTPDGRAIAPIGEKRRIPLDALID